ncbi:hypothetical protein CDAR_96411 [Caerostris darwini]|uniref:Uncharacterized protein n=1 Tax=Caerostris darwini TaxID=1538125 RepID=A0AAV4TEW6_9ARAC|nr:hypothetical protein CDAR_96411 [Caerostris darwini]
MDSFSSDFKKSLIFLPRTNPFVPSLFPKIGAITFGRKTVQEKGSVPTAAANSRPQLIDESTTDLLSISKKEFLVFLPHTNPFVPKIGAITFGRKTVQRKGSVPTAVPNSRPQLIDESTTDLLSISKKEFLVFLPHTNPFVPKIGAITFGRKTVQRKGSVPTAVPNSRPQLIDGYISADKLGNNSSK